MSKAGSEDGSTAAILEPGATTVAEGAAVAIIVSGQGKSVRLSTPAKWRRAIELNDLSPDMVVDVEEANGAVHPVRAGDIPQLWPVFEACGVVNTRLAAADDLEPPAETEPSPEPDFERANDPDPEPPTPPQPTEPAEPADVAPTPLPKPYPVVRKKRAGWKWAAAAGLLVLCWILWGNKPITPTPPETRYVSRPVNVRSVTTNDGNTPEAQLPRGEMVRGHWVLGQDNVTQWLKLSEGPYRGKYVWGRNLSNESRPPLADIIEQRLWTSGTQNLYAGPATASGVLQRLDTAIQVCVEGQTQSGWWEILIMSGSGGVGYLPPEGLSPGQPYRTLPESSSKAECL